MSQSINDLTSKKCIPCEGGVPPLGVGEEDQMVSLCSSWVIDRHESHKIRREFVFKDFRQAMAFLNRVADIAEEEGHHPDIHLSWNRLILELTTHSVNGLTENDFIVAAKINKLSFS